MQQQPPTSGNPSPVFVSPFSSLAPFCRRRLRIVLRSGDLGGSGVVVSAAGARARNNMEDDIHAGASATSKAVASASTHDTTHLKVGHYPVVDADTALVAVPLQLPDPFWTLCDNCRFQFEYEFKYRDLLIKCPQCSNPFIAKENYKVARTVDLVCPAQYQKNKCLVPKGKVAVQKLEAFQPTENVNVPESSQPIGGQGAFRESGEKRKMKELITPPGADYKAAQDQHLEKPPELHGMPMLASPFPQDVVSELQKIPDLAPDDFLKAFNILRRDHFKCRIFAKFPIKHKKHYLLKEIGSPLFHFKMDASLDASATVYSSLPSMDVIVATPATNVDLAPIPVALQTTFWTWCTNCGLAFEYLMTYKDCLLCRPHCHQTFEAKEKSLDSIVGQTCSSVPQAPNNDVTAAKCVLGQPSTPNLNVSNKICQHRGSYGVSMQSVPLISNENGSIMQPRQVKLQRKHLSETFGAHYKVPNDANFSKTYVPPAIWKKASPEDVIAELKNIPDLTPMNWSTAFGMLTYDDFQFRSLKELPMEFKKKWLLNEIKLM